MSINDSYHVKQKYGDPQLLRHQLKYSNITNKTII
jgi:hypothetical protein